MITPTQRLAEARALLVKARRHMRYTALFWGMEKDFNRFDTVMDDWDDIRAWLAHDDEERNDDTTSRA